MALIGLQALRPLLRCPRCHGPLAGDDGGLACSSPGCGLAGRAFPRVAGLPALVDFESSVLDEATLLERAGASGVLRRGDGGAGGALRRWSAPPSRVAGRHMRDLVARLHAGGGRPRVLVVGGGTRNPGSDVLYDDAGIDVIAFDIYASPDLRFIADAQGLPLADGSVQAVSVQAVLEHVLDPWRAVAEIERVLTPGGLVYAVTPFLQHVHEGAWDFTRFTESGHRWLFRAFERIDSGVVAGPATAWVWSTEQLVRGLTRSITAGKAVRLAFSCVHLLDRLIPESHAVDGASCVYFYGRKSDARLDPLEAVRSYRGAQRTA